MSLRLPDPAHAVKTSLTDPIRYHYQPIIRYFMNRRLGLALTALGLRRYRRVLDAGFGGGVFLPELAVRADELHGVDTHDHIGDVQRMADFEGIDVQLRQASLTATGFPDGFFDCVVCISVLEFIDDVASAIAEIRRIAAPNATIVLGFPGENFLTRLGYRLARSPDPRRVHRANWRMILSEANQCLKLRILLRFPALLPARFSLFFVGKFERT